MSLTSMRAIALCLALLALPLVSASQALKDPAGCEAVRTGVRHELLGRVLLEAPDLPVELQRISLMGDIKECFAYSKAKLAKYIEAHPDDHRASFVAARFVWKEWNWHEAILLLEPQVDMHPDFASGMVLLGALYLQKGEPDTALRHLEAARNLSPDDLWMTVNLLKARASQDDSVEARRQLLELANSTSAPPLVRMVSADFLKQTSPVDGPEYEALLRGKLSYEKGGFREDSIMELAGLLMRTQRHADARRALAEIMPPKHVPEVQVRALLAESLLREAADIASRVTPANQALVDQARAAVNGDFNMLALNTAANPDLSRKLAPFIRSAAALDPERRDWVGNTLLCNAVRSGDLQAVRDALADGADVNAICNSFTALDWSFLESRETPVDPAGRVAVTAALLEAGADLDKTLYRLEGSDGICQEYAWCRQNLLPILDAHRTRKSR